MVIKKKIQVKRFIAFGHGDLEFRNDKYYGKTSVIEYLHRISTYFDESYFFCPLSDTGNLKTMLQLTKVTPVCLDWKNCNNYITKIFNLLKFQYKLLKYTNKQTAIIINSPAIILTPLIPFIVLKSGHLCGFIASDAKGVTKILHSLGGVNNIIKGKIILIYDKLIKIFSKSLIISDDISKYHNYAHKSFMTKPIISLRSNIKYSYKNKKNFTIIYVGVLNKNKGAGILIEAFSNLYKKGVVENKFLKLKIIGDGPEYKNLVQKTKELNISDKVDFLGYIDNAYILGKEYLMSDLFVLPTVITEGQPRVIDEAMYYGLPVIITDHGYDKSIKHKQNAYIVKPGSAMELEKAMEQLIMDEEFRKKFIENGKKRINNSVGKESAADQHARIITKT